ncbi:ATP-binding cassette domain-containing protein [Amycolatopsis australiensis]|uniref:ATP-binding cassette domain-containing protein n=1 Tax=Amycolatopsis australiensis TaxID=546364 RepID=UPI001FEC34A6|nr:ATP-binding cassette domain-containing protein [Amycolatopsis australiensis]
MTHFVEVEAVTKSFGKVRALDDVSLQVPRGTVCGLLGHNGAGKTTLVNVLTTLVAPTSGRARVAGLDVQRDAVALRSRIGLTGQFASVDEQLSGFRNLILIARLLGASTKAAKARADELLTAFGLREAAARPAKTYSGGMRRRLDLAASLVGYPDVIFLDEPTTGLDPAARIAMWEIVEQLVRDGSTVLLTTQMLDEADRLADKIVVLAQGKVIAAGTAASLKAQVGKRTVTVTLAGAADSGRAEEAVRRAGMVPRMSGVDEQAGLVLTVPVEKSTDLARVVRVLDEAAIEPVELALVDPRLDDVYLALSAGSRPDVPAAGHREALTP